MLLSMEKNTINIQFCSSKKEKYQIGMDVGRPLFEQVIASGSDVAICDSETCRWQIGAATGAKMIHPVELIAYAYGLQDF